MRKGNQCGSESWKYEPKDGGTASDCGGEKDVGFYLIIMAAYPGPEYKYGSDFCADSIME